MAIPYAMIRGHIKTCDLILFRSHDIISNIIANIEHYVNGSADFTHIGMCIRGESFYYPDPGSRPPWLNPSSLYILEATATGINGYTHDVEGKSGLCVQLRDLDQVVRTYEKTTLDRMALMQIKDEHRPEHIDQESPLLQKEYDKYRGLYYDVSLIDLWATILPFMRTIRSNRLYKHICDSLSTVFVGNQRSSTTDHPELLPRDNVHSNWQFCSKLVANIYVDIGLFPSAVVPGDILPSDFEVQPARKHIPSTLFNPVVYFDP